jgi:hypothetical protein
VPDFYGIRRFTTEFTKFQSSNILSHANTLTVVYFNVSFSWRWFEAEIFGNWIYFRNQLLKPLLLNWGGGEGHAVALVVKAL